MEVYVIRHTPVDIGKDTCYGQTNVALAPTFFNDATYFKTQLTQQFDAVYCSPLNRCKALAEFLSLPNILLESKLMEMNFGDWENKKWNDIQEDELNKWMFDFVNVKPPNGENLLALYTRVKQFTDELRNTDHKKVLLITHAGVIRCLWSYLLDIPLQHIFKIPVQHNEIFVFKLGPNPLMDAIKQFK